MRLVLIRHGETDWNRRGKIQGVTDISLNENGIKSAGELADRLKNSDYSFSVVYSSPLKRAYETGEILARELNIPIKVKENLSELCFGKFEGLSWAEVEESFPSEYHYWNTHRKKAAPPEGESYYHKSLLVLKDLKEIVEENPDAEDILVVSHSATLKAIMCPIKHVDYNDMLKVFVFRNLSEIVLEDRDIKEILAYEG